MRYNQVIFLMSEKIQEDDLGNQIEVHTKRKVYANEYDVSSSEFYNASVTGIKPSNSWQVKTFEYSNEEKLTYNGKEYNIVRTSTRGDVTTLICEKVLKDG